MNRKILSVSWGYTKIGIFNKVKTNGGYPLKYAYTQKRDLHNISTSSTAIKIQETRTIKYGYLYRSPLPPFLEAGIYINLIIHRFTD